MSKVMITVEYSCELCGVVWRPVMVREREEDEDVVHWTEWAMACVSGDHRKASPMCLATMVDLKVPMASPKARIGQAVRQ